MLKMIKMKYLVQMVCAVTGTVGNLTLNLQLNSIWSKGTISMFCGSIALGWTSPMMSKLLSDDGPLHLSSAEGANLVSLMLFGAFLSPIPTAWIMDR